MDQELIAYFDRRFGDLIKDQDRRFGRIDRRFAENEKATQRAIKELGKELREDLGGRIEEQGTKIEEQGKKVEALGEQVDTQIRETQIMVEGLRSTIETVAESVIATNTKLDRSHEDHERERQKDLAFCTSLFSDVKGRVDEHEDRLSDCEARVTRIESAGG